MRCILLAVLNAHGHQPCSCTVLDFCTARGCNPSEPGRSAPSIILGDIIFPIPHVQCESCCCTVFDLWSTVSAQPLRLSSCLNEIADCSASICSLLKAWSNTPEPANIRDVFIFFAFLEMPAVRLILASPQHTFEADTDAQDMSSGLNSRLRDTPRQSCE